LDEFFPAGGFKRDCKPVKVLVAEDERLDFVLGGF
jgi:hypothetical protein